MTPDPDLSAPKRWNMYVAMPSSVEKTKWTSLEVEEGGDWVLFADHTAAVAKAVEAERAVWHEAVTAQSGDMAAVYTKHKAAAIRSRGVAP